ncbi:glutathione S-transferase family protein [Parasphingorhabdus sp.]|uniref:glutathione S-transferase family protein n=1 Tax=Parasphingorhabdus sp. TaxID=2709688 RepID=UPI003A8D48B8
MTLKFYTNPMSRAQIVRWALHEVAADYDQVLLEYGTTMKADDYLKINPMGKVPAIDHDGKIITECAAICAYLAEVFPDAELAPTASEQADYFRWLFFTSGPVEQAIINRSLGFAVTADQERMAGYGNYDRVVDVLDAKFQADQYACGERFTMADVYVGAQIVWGTQFGTLPDRDSFLAYAKRVTDRSAYLAAKAIDDGLIAEASQ